MAGVGVIVVFYWCGKDSRAELPTSADSAVKLSYFSLRQNIEVVIISALTYILCLGMRQLYALLALIPINMYNGERGRWNLKYVFYMFLSGAFAHHMVYMDYMEKITVDYWL